MKITIELDELQVKAFKAYLKECSDKPKVIINKAAIANELKGMIDAELQNSHSALGSCYLELLNKG